MLISNSFIMRKVNQFLTLRELDIQPGLLDLSVLLLYPRIWCPSSSIPGTYDLLSLYLYFNVASLSLIYFFS